jgi:hypothetical protein
VVGYLGESQATEHVTQSRALTGLGTRVTFNEVADQDSPFADGSCQELIASADNDTHIVEGSMSVTSGSQYVAWAILKHGGDDYDVVGIVNTSHSDEPEMLANLETGAIDVSNSTNLGSADEYGLLSIGNDWYLAYLTCTADGTATDYARLRLYDTDGTTASWLGDGSTTHSHCAYFGFRSGGDLARPDSPIETSGSSATRVTDALYYDVSGVSANTAIKGTMSCTLLAPDSSAAVDVDALELNDGGSSDDEIKMSINTDGYLTSTITTGGETQSNLVRADDVLDGSEHDCRIQWAADLAMLSTDRAFGANNETNLLTDGDMETSGVGDWAVFNSSTLTKESGTRPGGSGSQYLRVTYGGTSDPAAEQDDQFVLGNVYRATGWARGDGGSAYPQLHDATSVLWSGTSANDWQYFDVVFAPQNVQLRLYALGATGAGEYCDWDDIQILDYTNIIKDTTLPTLPDDLDRLYVHGGGALLSEIKVWPKQTTK